MIRRLLSLGAILTFCGAAFAQINDGFETYANGPLAPQGGWEIWYSGGANAAVISTNAHTGSKSVQMSPASDIVQRFTIVGGLWTASVWTFVPAESLDGYFIMQNQYETPSDNWSIQVRFNGDSTDPLGNVVESQWDGATLPVIVDTWVEFRAEIDLDADLVNTFYDDQPLGVDLSWTNNVSEGGTLTIACIDLYSATVDGMLWDDVLLEGGGAGCPGDINDDGIRDLSDLALLLSQFGSTGGNFPADINGDGDVGISDLALMLSGFDVPC